MKKWIIVFAACLCLGMARVPRVKVKNVYFEKNFNTSDVSGLSYSGNKTAKIVDKAVKITLNYTDPINYRTEVQVNDFAEIGKTYWYGVKTLIPNDWGIDSKPEIIMQWHGYPDKDLGENWRNPVVALYVAGDRYLLKVRGDAREVAVKPFEVDKIIDLGQVFKGKRESWIFQIDWDYTDGRIKVWKNNIQLATINGANCYNDMIGPYFKFGVYKWEWKTAPSDVSSRTLYFDDLKIGKE